MNVDFATRDMQRNAEAITIMSLGSPYLNKQLTLG
jgi:hypothetical protein